VSTVEDFLAFLQVFSANANADVLHPESVRLISSDAMTSRQRADVQALTGPGTSWGLGVGVDIERVHPWMQPGRFGWNGGSGTTAFVDPVNGLSAVLLTQRMMSEATGDFDEFWSAVYSSL
jgi:CubicO group peptidase (beta-lactamase class C family)